MKKVQNEVTTTSMEPYTKPATISKHKHQLLVRIPKRIVEIIGIKQGDRIVFKIERSDSARKPSDDLLIKYEKGSGKGAKKHGRKKKTKTA